MPILIKIAFYVNVESQPLGETNPTASVFLNTAESTDEAINLSWEEMVPWDNFEYTIFRQNESSNFMILLVVLTELSFLDTELIKWRRILL